MPKVEMMRIAWSANLPWLRAATAATGTAISTDSTTLHRTSISVGSMRVRMSFSTSIL